MIKEAIEKILALSAPTISDVNGRVYCDRAVNAIKPPVQADLDVVTLSAIADYYRENPDNIDLSKTIVHVVAPNRVQVISAVADEWLQRHHYLDATTKPEQFRCGQYVGVEQFLIAMQTYFVQDEVTAAMLQVVGNIVDETSVKVLDDGVTQEITAKAGIARVSTVALPNPVELAPYRTFLEVEQPSSKFIFRLKKSDGGPTAALFEADGGNWQRQCIISVRDWLRERLPDGTTILA